VVRHIWRRGSTQEFQLNGNNKENHQTIYHMYESYHNMDQGNTRWGYQVGGSQYQGHKGGYKGRGGFRGRYHGCYGRGGCCRGR
jgi:hypothetical protein